MTGQGQPPDLGDIRISWPRCVACGTQERVFICPRCGKPCCWDCTTITERCAHEAWHSDLEDWPDAAQSSTE